MESILEATQLRLSASFSDLGATQFGVHTTKSSPAATHIASPATSLVSYATHINFPSFDAKFPSLMIFLHNFNVKLSISSTTSPA
jgi:hypothetical protein